MSYHKQVCDNKTKLEEVSLDGSTVTSDLVLNVTYLLEMKCNVIQWENEISILVDAERLLKRQRHNFGSDWVEGSRLQGQLEHLKHILAKRLKSMEEEMPILQTIVIAEDKLIEQKTAELLEHWARDKPLRGIMTPSEAKEGLSRFAITLKKAKTDEDNLIKAKGALGLDTKIRNKDIETCIDEMNDLNEVWEAITSTFDSLENIKQTQWISATPRKIRMQLEDLANGKIKLAKSFIGFYMMLIADLMKPSLFSMILQN